MATVFLPQIIIGFGNGLLLPTSIAGAVSVRPQVAGTASGMTGFIQMAIGAGAAQLSGHAIARRLGCHADAAADAVVRLRHRGRLFRAGATPRLKTNCSELGRKLGRMFQLLRHDWQNNLY